MRILISTKPSTLPTVAERMQVTFHIELMLLYDLSHDVSHYLKLNILLKYKYPRMLSLLPLQNFANFDKLSIRKPSSPVRHR